MTRLVSFVVAALLVGSLVPAILQATSPTSAFLASPRAALPNQFNPSTSTTCTYTPGIAVVPCTTTSATIPSAVMTDWSVVSVGMEPSSQFPAGTSVTFNMTMTVVSSTGDFPQDVAVQCLIDGNDCGSGVVTYPGPVGTDYLVTAQVPWIATAGTHTLTWQIDTTNDPNPNNNSGTLNFQVATPTPFDFNITASPSVMAAQQGEEQHAVILVRLVNGTSQPVTLSTTGVPSGVTASLTSVSGTPTFISALALNVSSTVVPGNYSITITASGGGESHFTTLTLDILGRLQIFTPTVASHANSTSSATSFSIASSVSPPTLAGFTAGMILASVLVIAGSALIVLSRRPPSVPPELSAGRRLFLKKILGTGVASVGLVLGLGELNLIPGHVPWPFGPGWACYQDSQLLQQLGTNITQLETQNQQLQQQLMQQQQNSINTGKYVNQALLSVAVGIQQVIINMTDYGNEMMADSNSSTQGIEFYNAGFTLVGWANDLQNHDDFQQLTILLNFASADASQQDWQGAIDNLNAANEALTAAIQAISKDLAGIGQVYGYVLDYQLDPSGGSNPNGPLTQLQGLHDSLNAQIQNLENLSEGEISIAISQLTNILSIPGQIQDNETKLATLETSYSEVQARVEKEC